MNFIARDLSISFQVGKSGGSTGQPCDIKRSGRGLVQEQSDPLVIWWVKLLKQENSAERLSASRQKSYRRSRWGLPTTKPASSISPFSAMHKDGRLLTPSAGAVNFAFLVFLGLTASLNVVALAEPAATSAGRSAASANEIPSAKRFSMMKDFVGQHNQYLDLSKLSEFKWTDETRVAARGFNEKRHIDQVFTDTDSGLVAQPHAVQSEKRRQKKNDAQLTEAQESFDREPQRGYASGFRSVSKSKTTHQSSAQSTGDAPLDLPYQKN